MAYASSRWQNQAVVRTDDSMLANVCFETLTRIHSHWRVINRNRCKVYKFQCAGQSRTTCPNPILFANPHLLRYLRPSVPANISNWPSTNNGAIMFNVVEKMPFAPSPSPIFIGGVSTIPSHGWFMASTRQVALP